VVEIVVGVLDDGFVDGAGGAVGEYEGCNAGVEAEEGLEEVSWTMRSVVEHQSRIVPLRTATGVGTVCP
jgi:hypothetical protein